MVSLTQDLLILQDTNQVRIAAVFVSLSSRPLAARRAGFFACVGSRDPELRVRLSEKSFMTS